SIFRQVRDKRSFRVSSFMAAAPEASITLRKSPSVYISRATCSQWPCNRETVDWKSDRGDWDSVLRVTNITSAEKQHSAESRHSCALVYWHALFQFLEPVYSIVVLI